VRPVSRLRVGLLGQPRCWVETCRPRYPPRRPRRGSAPPHLRCRAEDGRRRAAAVLPGFALDAGNGAGGGRGVPCPPALENTWRPTGFPRCGQGSRAPLSVTGTRPARSGACVARRRAVADETDLRLYAVEHDLRGLLAAQLADVRRAPDAAVRRAIRRGSHIRYVPRIWAPDEHRCRCLSESAGPDPVRHGNGRRAGPAGPPGCRAQPGDRREQPVADREQDRPSGQY
jgi:hypothetical protein